MFLFSADREAGHSWFGKGLKLNIGQSWKEACSKLLLQTEPEIHPQTVELNIQAELEWSGLNHSTWSSQRPDLIPNLLQLSIIAVYTNWLSFS